MKAHKCYICDELCDCAFNEEYCDGCSVCYAEDEDEFDGEFINGFEY